MNTKNTQKTSNNKISTTSGNEHELPLTIAALTSQVKSNQVKSSQIKYLFQKTGKETKKSFTAALT